MKRELTKLKMCVQLYVTNVRYCAHFNCTILNSTILDILDQFCTQINYNGIITDPAIREPVTHVSAESIPDRLRLCRPRSARNGP